MNRKQNRWRTGINDQFLGMKCHSVGTLIARIRVLVGQRIGENETVRCWC